jgi:PAT family acetyl-CoA transporter-like MFS transporter 1
MSDELRERKKSMSIDEHLVVDTNASQIMNRNPSPGKIMQPEKPIVQDALVLEDCSGFSSTLGSKDRFSMLILLVLYTLQGIPMGLSGSIPLLLKEKGASYEALAMFSLVSMPFSLKLLWAPLVDTFYFKSFGRRKSWLVPVQILTGLIMVSIGSWYIDEWMGTKSSSPATGPTEPNVQMLTVFFTILYLFMATQDIAVDGWALTMLSRENVSYGSVCNTIGQLLGYFVANQGFIALSDPLWCHRWLGMEEGLALVTLAGFMEFWGYVFIITTIVVWAFKKEDVEYAEGEHVEGLMDTCRHVVSIVRMPPVQSLLTALLTMRMAFAAVDAATTFKLQEYGMPKSDLATISPLLLLTGLFLPALASNPVTMNPMGMMCKAIPLKLLSSLLMWAMVMQTEEAYKNGPPGITYFGPLIVVSLLNEVAGTLIFISQMSFFSKVSDPNIGGSYMTLLNTVANLGAKWPHSLCLYLLPKMTFTACEMLVAGEWMPAGGHVTCSSRNVASCRASGGQCNVQLDGYTIQSACCFLIGVVWFLLFKGRLMHLQSIPFTSWLVFQPKKSLSDNNLDGIVYKDSLKQG